MKTAIFLLIMAIGFMWYRGDLNNLLQGIDALVNPQVATQQAGELPKGYFEAVQREVGQAVNKKRPSEDKNTPENKTVTKDKRKPVTLDIFTKEKSTAVAQAKWLESNKVNDGESLMGEKFRKLLSEGKHE